MIMHVSILAAVVAGFLIGGFYGGHLGSILGGTTSMLLCLSLTDLYLFQRPLDGFLLRHRGTITNSLVLMVLVLLGTYLLGEIWGPITGVFFAESMGRHLTNRLRWAGAEAERDLLARIHFLSYPASIAGYGAGPSLEEAKALERIAQHWLSPIGLAAHSDLACVVTAAVNLTPNEESLQFFRHCLPEQRRQILLDCLEVVHARKEVDPLKRQQISTLESLFQLPDRGCVEFFEREATLERLRTPALAALGLSPQATEAEVDQTYRNAVRQFHPDRVQGVPAHLSELAREKMVALNQAYGILKSADLESLRYRFREHTSDDTMEPDGRTAFTCRCWRCSQANRIPEEVRLSSVRCGGCRAFLGMPSQ